MILISLHHIHGRLGPVGTADERHEQRQQSRATLQLSTRLNQAYTP
jgi:hypothetical protein